MKNTLNFAIKVLAKHQNIVHIKSMDTKTSSKILIGGRALVNLGSSRATEDTDYLVNDTTTDAAFIHSEDGSVDLINANGNAFFAEIFAIENGNEQATPRSLLELKAYSFVQHCENFNFEKADQAEFDMKFLARKFNITSAPIAEKYISQGAINTVRKVLDIRK